MKNFWPNLLTTVVGGTIVSVFTYLFLVPSEATPNVETIIWRANIPREFSDELVAALESEFSASIDELTDREFLVEGSEGGYELLILELKSWLASNLPQYVEVVEVINNESSLSARVKIEGRSTELAFLSSAKRDTSIFNKDFDDELALLPREMIRVTSISTLRGSESLHSGSERIYVSQGGVYIQPSNLQPVLENPIVGAAKNYPFVVFLLSMAGVYAVFFLTISAISAFLFDEKKEEIDEESE